MDKLLDRYAWQARALPALIALLPIGLTFMAWVPKVQDVAKPLIGAVVGAGLVLLIANLARDAGKSVQEGMLKDWGGWPSKTMLRHGDESLDVGTKARYHARLGDIVPKVKMPSAADEAQDPESADQVYEACASYLVAKTRDQKAFPLVFAENIGYGFRRNLLGLKPLGIVAALAGTCGCGWKLYSDRAAAREASPLAVACVALCLALLVAWVFFVHAKLVRRSADDYARRLLASIDQL